MMTNTDKDNINRLLKEAQVNIDKWKIISESPDKLEELDKTKENAISLFSYFEGRFDALFDIKRCLS
jgi:hypothetical protein